MPFKLSPQEKLVLEALASGCNERETSIRVGIPPKEFTQVWHRIRQEFEGASATSVEGVRLSEAFYRAERRRLQVELWASEARLTALMDISPEAILLVNGRTGTIEGANEPAVSMFGYSLGEIVGLEVESLIAEELGELHVAFRQSFLSGPRKRKMGYHSPVYAKHKNGGSLALDVALTATTNDDILVLCKVSPQAA